jgi:hypothetical protein
LSISTIAECSAQNHIPQENSRHFPVKILPSFVISAAETHPTAAYPERVTSSVIAKALLYKISK